ncbi:MAG: preprotein translocase subunit SecE [Erysipelotrichaceae bacterium]
MAGIRAEIHRIRWPKLKDLTNDSVMVIMFTTAFAIFFFVCEWFAKMWLNFIGI